MSFVGSANEQAIMEVWPFYQLVRQHLLPSQPILDFGVGWGRIIRLFLRDVDAKYLHGVDVDPDVIALCKRLDVPGELSTIGKRGALPYPDRYFGTIYAYSVFSRLSPESSLHWIEEIKRLLARVVCLFSPA